MRNDLVHVGNYLARAIAEGIVGEVWWVVPDWRQDAAATRRTRHGRVWVTPCRMASLPALSGGVLLDIDVDFLLQPGPADPPPELGGVLPWCWPSALVDRLAGSIRSVECLTIATSVVGGFTPQRWHYLGLELAARLSDSPDAALRVAFEHVREGAVAAAAEDHDRAEACFTAAGVTLPIAAPWYHLAALLLRAGRLEDARHAYGRVLAIDPDYRNPFNTPAPLLRRARRHDEAAAVSQRMLSLDPDDPWAGLGVALRDIRARRWEDAEAHLRGALARAPRSIDVWRALAVTLRGLHRYPDAVEAYEESLRLALHGEVPLDAPPCTRPPALLDPDHWRTHARLAGLYERLGRSREAEAARKVSGAATRYRKTTA